MFWAKTLLSVTLTCYLAVSSIAAVHAFPTQPLQDGYLISASIVPDMKMSKMMPSCHQEVSDASQNSVSTCDIFCAAMTNVISNDPVVEVAVSNLSTEHDFLPNGFHTREASLEPHPPK